MDERYQDNEFASYFERLFDSSNEGIFFVDQEGCFKKVNPTVTRMLGYTPAELVGRRFSEIMHRSKKVQKLTSYNRLYHFIQSEHTATEMQLVHKDGHSVPVKLLSILIRADDDRVIEAIGMLSHVTAEKTIAEKTGEAQQNLENLLNHSGDAIVLCDVHGKISKANLVLQQMLDYSERELLEMHLIELSPFAGMFTTTLGERMMIDDEYVEYQVKKAEELFSTGRVINYELYFIRRDQILVPVEVTVSVLKDDSGERRGSIALVRDITERKRSEIFSIFQKSRLARSIFSPSGSTRKSWPQMCAN